MCYACYLHFVHQELLGLILEAMGKEMEDNVWISCTGRILHNLFKVEKDSSFSFGRRLSRKPGELNFKSLQSDKMRNILSEVDWHCLLENGL